MADASVLERVRRARELMLAIFAVWLVIQNLVLLVFVPWSDLGRVAVVVGALVKAALLVVAPLWFLPIAILTGVALTSMTVRESVGPRAGVKVEVRHG